ncbi:MAG: nucleotidyltransferase family protein [Leptospirales bacterium]
MEAVVLAGGLGTRLRSVVPDLPKPMASVNGRPFLEFLLDFWIGEGVDRFVLSVGYKHETVQNHFGSAYRSVPVDYSVEENPLGTGGGILLALEKIRTTKPFLLVNGDTYFDVNASGFQDFHQKAGADLTMVLRTMSEAGRFGTVRLGEEGRLEQFCAPGEGTAPYLINGGIYLVNPGFLEKERLRWDGHTPLSLEGDLFPKWIREQNAIFGWQGTGAFIDIGIPEEYRRCHELFHSFQ